MPLAAAYKITVIREAPSVNASLVSLAGYDGDEPYASGNGSKDAPWRKDINVPNALVGIGRDDIVVAPGATFLLYNGSITAVDGAVFNGEPVNSVSLTAGVSTPVYVKVTAQDGSTARYYKIVVRRAADGSDIAELISVESQLITPASGNGMQATTPYRASITVPQTRDTLRWNTVSVVGLKKLYTDQGFTTEVDATATMALAHGANTVYIKVTSRDTPPTNTKYYAISIYRELPSSDATLYTLGYQAVVASSGSGTQSNPYAASVTIPASPMIFGGNSIVVGSHAVYRFYTDSTFNTEQDNSTWLPYPQVGSNQFFIKITAQNTTTINYYVVDVTRPQPSGDASIYSIAGKTPTEGSGAGTYDDPKIMRVTVPNSKSRIVASEDIVVHISANVMLRALQDITSEQLTAQDLSVGENHLYVLVISEDLASSKQYDIIVTRENPVANPPAVSQTAVDSGASMTDTSVTLPSAPAGQRWEYRVSRDGGQTWGAWQDSPVFTGLATDKTYTFQIRTKADASHIPSAPVVVTVRTKPAQGANNGDGKQTTNPPAGADAGAGKVVLPKTKVTKVAVGKRLAKISFKKVAKANKVTKYQVQYRVKGVKKWKAKNFTVKYTGATTAKVTVKKLKKGKRYQFRVRAWKAVGAKKYYAPWSAAKLGKKVK
jgi:hypothetical protein